MRAGRDDMRVVITGASRGIGRATALKLASEGAERSPFATSPISTTLEELARGLRTSGATVKTLKADMARPTAPARVIAAAAKAMGGIDAIVGNAGINRAVETRRGSISRPGTASSTLISAPTGCLPGGLSVSQAQQGFDRDAGLDGRRHAATADRRLQSGQGCADHADPDDGDGMGARRHPRQCRLPGLRPPPR